jgi:hypothetical protein
LLNPDTVVLRKSKTRKLEYRKFFGNNNFLYVEVIMNPKNKELLLNKTFKIDDLNKSPLPAVNMFSKLIYIRPQLLKAATRQLGGENNIPTPKKNVNSM